MKKLRVIRNIYGNWNLYVGNSHLMEAGADEFHAIDLASELLKQGIYSLSEKSDITMNMVESHRAHLS